MSLLAAVWLSLPLATGAYAVTWSLPIAVAAYPRSSGGIATLNDAIVIAVDGWGAVRRSTDGGMTWGDWDQLALLDAGHRALYADIAGSGDNVDVVWEQFRTDNLGSGHIRYARSTDGGETYADSTRLSDAIYLYDLAVVRGPGGMVAVIWIEDDLDQSSDVVMRVSADGGATFGPRRLVWEHVDAFEVSAAVGDGVIYAGFVQPYSGANWSGSVEPGLHVRRSLDNGDSWGQSMLIGGRSGPYCGSLIDMTAEGDRAFVGFTRRSRPGFHPSCTPSYRGTSDKGSSWDIRGKLARPAWTGDGPMVSLDDGVVRAIFNRCTSGSDCAPALFYRESADGIDWTPKQQLTNGGEAYPADIAVQGSSVLALYGYYDDPTGTDESRLLIGTP
jgi:hypothetical protein